MALARTIAERAARLLSVLARAVIRAAEWLLEVSGG